MNHAVLCFERHADQGSSNPAEDDLIANADRLLRPVEEKIEDCSEHRSGPSSRPLDERILLQAGTSPFEELACAAIAEEQQPLEDRAAALGIEFLAALGTIPQATDAVERVENKPESEARQAVLKEELETAQAGQDADVVQSAGALLDLLKEHGLASGPSYQATLSGSGAIAQGEGAVAAGERGVAVGGDVKGGTIVTGEKDEGPRTKDEGDR